MSKSGSEQMKALQLACCEAVIESFRFSVKARRKALKVALEQNSEHRKALAAMPGADSQALSGKALKRATESNARHRHWLKQELRPKALKKAKAKSQRKARFILAAVWPDLGGDHICVTVRDRKQGIYLGRRVALSTPFGDQHGPDDIAEYVWWWLDEPHNEAENWVRIGGDVIRWSGSLGATSTLGPALP